jgi:hypothetical protein
VDHDDDRVDYEIDSDDEEWLTEYHVASSRNAALIQAFKRSDFFVPVTGMCLLTWFIRIKEAKKQRFEGRTSPMI